MAVVWKKRKGQWYLISDIYKRILEEVETEVELPEEDGGTGIVTTSESKYDNGILWFKHNNEWIDIFNPEKDFITNGDPSHDTFESVEDGDMVEIKCRNFFVKRGHTVTVSNRCKGLILNLTGDLIVYGNISMTARGAAAEGRYLGIDYVNNTVTISENAETNPFLADTFKVSLDTTLCDKCGLCYDACNYQAIKLDTTETTDEETGEIIVTINNVSLDTDNCVNCGACVDTCIAHGINAFTKTYDIMDNHYVISPTGGIGNVNAVGGNGINGACGAGGGCATKVGGNGTCFSGGSGAGGATYYTNSIASGQGKFWWNSSSTPNTEGSSSGGAGGSGGIHNSYSSYGGAGGAGNPGGTGPYYSTAGENGTGGLLIVFVKGNIIFGDSCLISSNGSKGGAVTKSYSYRGSGHGATTYVYSGQGGAGSGGGAIHIFYNGTINNIIENTEIIVAKGGAGGAGGSGGAGRAGGDGTIHVAKVQPDGTLSY